MRLREPPEDNASLYAASSERDAIFMLVFPLSHRGTIQMVKAVTVEVDEKGRVHIPSSIRHELKSRRFTLSVKKGRLVMDPVKPATTVRGKYRGLLKASIEEIEEAQERFVAADRR
jgi:bifunctional DNA-binding transcriptional regulator/antitoxin component of YhaV-PrlF toxin-antitoxin module